MLKIVTIALIGVCLVDAQQYQPSNHQFQQPSQHQQQQPQQPYSSGSGYSGYSGYSPSSGQSSLYTTTTPRPYFPPAQVHYVNIGQDLAGDYKFGYDTGKGPSGQSFREEVRLPDGTVMGAYGYLDEHGKQRIVKYTAGKEGFKVDSDTPAPSNDDASKQQQASRPASPPTPQVSHSRPQAAPQYLPQQYLPSAPRPQPQPQYQPPPQPPTPPRYQQISQPQYRSEPTPQPYQTSPQQYQQAPQQHYQPPPQQYQPPPQSSYQPPPSYQSSAAYQAPAVQFKPQPAPAPAPAQYRQPRAQSYQPSNQELLSAFPQLPGVQLMVINPRPRPAAQYTPQAYNAGYLPSTSSNTLLQSQSRNVPKKEEEEYTGPVVINAALLNYDIGAGRRNTN